NSPPSWTRSPTPLAYRGSRGRSASAPRLINFLRWASTMGSTRRPVEATMTILSAPGDTWGISGLQFVLIFLGLLVAGTLLAVVLRVSATRPRSEPPGRLPTPAEAALLAEGRDRAVYAVAAGLRVAGAIGTDDRK